jgi:predicted S18 family serine protease
MSATSDFYLTRAAECGREAEATALANVRERFLRSQEAWLSMANRLQKGEALRDQATAEKAARTETN